MLIGDVLLEHEGTGAERQFRGELGLQPILRLKPFEHVGRGNPHREPLDNRYLRFHQLKLDGVFVKDFDPLGSLGVAFLEVHCALDRILQPTGRCRAAFRE